MTIRFHAFIATSVDGCIADANGSIEWLEEANMAIPEGEDCGFSNFISGIDVLVMGRNTFEQALRFPEWPYGLLPVFVLSHSRRKLPGSIPDTIELHDLAIADLVTLLSRRRFENVYVDGGKTIQGFIVAGVLNEITVTSIPVLSGAGASLFGPVAWPVHLQRKNSRVYPRVFVQSTYRVSSAWRVG